MMKWTKRETRIGIRILALVAAIFLSGCATLLPALSPGGFLRGRVVFDDGAPMRRTQATMTEVATAATVSLIDTASNQTVATTVTDIGGAFVLTWPKTFVAGPDPYYLEAIKGLNNNAVGYDAIRVRTMVTFANNNLSDSLTGTQFVNVSRLTTALSILSDLLRLDTNARMNLMGQVIDMPDGSLGAPNLPASILSQADINGTVDLISTLIQNNVDPIASIDYNNGPVLRASAGLKPPSITSLDPNPATAGSRIVISGADFGSSTSGVSVSLNGVAMAIQYFASNRIEVTLPANAASGLLTVSTGLGKAVVTCDVVPKVSGTLPGASF